MDELKIVQTVAILIDGNNMDKSVKTANVDGEFVIMMDYDRLVPRLVGRRSLSRLFYLREGTSISKKLADRLHNKFYGIVKPCHKSADVPLAIEAVQLVDKVDTIIILSGDADYLELVKYLSSRGCRTEIAAFAPSTSRVLMEAADFYHEITTDDCFVTNERKPVVTPAVVPVKKSKKSKSKKSNMALDVKPVDVPVDISPIDTPQQQPNT